MLNFYDQYYHHPSTDPSVHTPSGIVQASHDEFKGGQVRQPSSSNEAASVASDLVLILVVVANI